MRWCFEDIDVYVADDRESALSHLRRVEPQVVTLDLGLPPNPGGTSVGFALLQDILTLAPLTKIIVVTGREEHANAVKDRKSTRLNSSHVKISYAVFCLKKKNQE